MEDLFMSYMTERFVKDLKDRPDPLFKPNGPLITLSREYGCPSKKLVQLIYEKIKNLYGTSACPWKVVSKEILNEAAQKVGLEPSRLAYVFKDVEKTFMDEVVESMTTRYYVSDRRIKKAIVEVMNQIARQGHVIIVGRGGVAIAQNMTNALHIRLFASVDWRINELMERKGQDEKLTRGQIAEMDAKRWKLIREFGLTDADERSFDLLLNCEKLSLAQMADAIIGVSLSKGFFASK
jgi:cytidylate kinase